MNYTESVLHICLLLGDSGLTSSILLLVNSCKCTEAVPSINYIGRQLDVSYIGREMYGEISIYQIRI